jgi:hypothetical protein
MAGDGVNDARAAGDGGGGVGARRVQGRSLTVGRSGLPGGITT